MTNCQLLKKRRNGWLSERGRALLFVILHYSFPVYFNTLLNKVLSTFNCRCKVSLIMLIKVLGDLIMVQMRNHKFFKDPETLASCTYWEILPQSSLCCDSYWKYHWKVDVKCLLEAASLSFIRFFFFCGVKS